MFTEAHSRIFDSLVLQIFHPTEPRVIGILDWELCTLGSPLADLGNLLLPFSIAPIRDKALLHTLTGGKGETGLLIGLKGLPSDKTGLPLREEIEKWWVEGMNEGLKRNGARDGRANWVLPIQHMRWVELSFSALELTLSWVRSWILFRLAIISQGIAARAALGQASSAEAKADNTMFNLLGKLAWQAKEDADGEESKARL